MLQYELRLSQIESAERAKIQELRERLEVESQERVQKARPLHISSGVAARLSVRACVVVCACVSARAYPCLPVPKA